jgi:hypothetical protein
MVASTAALDSARMRNHLPLLPALCLLGILVPARLSAEPTYRLESGRRAGDLSRVEVVVEVRGEFKAPIEGKMERRAMSVVGRLQYDERLLATDPDQAGVPIHSIRHVGKAEASIRINDRGLPPRTLNPERRLIVAQASEPLTLFSPQGRLTRDDLDLVTLVGDSLVVDRLLPTEEVALGGTWKIDTATLARLLHLEAIEVAEVECVLKEVDASVAKMELAGAVHGSVGGVATEIELRANYQYDRQRKCVRWIALGLKEKRAVGHVAPGVEATSRLVVHIHPSDASPELAAGRLVGLVLEATDEQLLLDYQPVWGALRLAHDRRWHATVDERQVAVLRFVDRGELVAQLNLAPLADREPGRAKSLEPFQREIKEALGERFGQFVKASQFSNDQQYRILRVEVLGRVSELPIRWVYYYIADAQGRNTALVFTMEAELAGRFADADEQLVSRLRLLDSPPREAKRN